MTSPTRDKAGNYTLTEDSDSEHTEQPPAEATVLPKVKVVKKVEWRGVSPVPARHTTTHAVQFEEVDDTDKATGAGECLHADMYTQYVIYSHMSVNSNRVHL